MSAPRVTRRRGGGLQPIGSWLPARHKRALRAVAEVRGISMSAITREAITAYLDLADLPADVVSWQERQRVLAREVAAADPPPAAESPCLVTALRADWRGDLISELRASA